MATNVPVHQPVTNLNVIKIMISVYKVVMVAIIARNEALNKISLCLICSTWRYTSLRGSLIQLSQIWLQVE